MEEAEHRTSLYDSQDWCEEFKRTDNTTCSSNSCVNSWLLWTLEGINRELYNSDLAPAEQHVLNMTTTDNTKSKNCEQSEEVDCAL